MHERDPTKLTGLVSELNELLGGRERKDSGQHLLETRSRRDVVFDADPTANTKKAP